MIGANMKFKQWLKINEMASFSLPSNAQFSIPCRMIKLQLPLELQNKLNCKDAPITMIDFRFEGPPAYDPPFNGFHNDSKFIAKLPNSSEYLVHHASLLKSPEILPEKQAKELNYPKIPDYWFVRAELFGPDDQVIKPALGEITGERQAHFKGSQ